MSKNYDFDTGRIRSKKKKKWKYENSLRRCLVKLTSFFEITQTLQKMKFSIKGTVMQII